MAPLNPVRKGFGKALPTPTPRFGLGWAGPQSLPSKTGKRSGTAAPNKPKMDQKRSVTAAENGTSESGKKRLWESFAYAYTKVWAGLGWAHEGLGWAEAGQTQLGGRGCGLSWAQVCVLGKALAEVWPQLRTSFSGASPWLSQGSADS